MSSRKTILIAASAAILMRLGAPARAAAPNLLTYQGQLQESGAPVTGNRDVEIKLCDALTAGNCFSTGVQSAAVSQGLFRVNYSVPAEVDLATGKWFLEVSVGPSGGTRSAFTPREAFSSSAYAMHASSASTLVAAPNTDGVVISTNVGIGTASPTAPLDVTGKVKVGGTLQLGVSNLPCTSLAGGSLQWTGTAFQVCDGVEWRTLYPPPLPSECSAYSIYDAFSFDDRFLTSGWYRITAGIGTLVENYNYGFCANHTSYYNNYYFKGAKPTVVGSSISGTACRNSSCTNPVTISVTNCGSYWVYNLVPLTYSYYKYCVASF